MDSSAYRYFIRELQAQPVTNFSFLPLRFMQSSPILDQSSFSCLTQFLKSVIFLSGTDDTKTLPEILATPHNFFGKLFIDAHRALLEVLNGVNPKSHSFLPNGINLEKFFSLYGNSNRKGITSSLDMTSEAMICFLTEGLLHAGWCPDAMKGNAKRAAHACFNVLKKNLHHAKTGHSGMLLGYLWGAWLMAQQTENIHDDFTAGFSPTETFEWNYGGEKHAYLGRIFGKPYQISLIPQIQYEIPHPIFKVWRKNKTGLLLYASGELIRPEALLEHSEIVRPKITGNKFVYQCRTVDIPGIRWTVVFLFYEKTIFRIDMLKLPLKNGPVTVHAELRLDNEAKLEEIKQGYFTGYGPENSIIRFLRDPFGFRLVPEKENGVSMFKSIESEFTGVETIQSVCAWAKGKGITELNETKLLGIYE